MFVKFVDLSVDRKCGEVDWLESSRLVYNQKMTADFLSVVETDCREQVASW